MATIIPRAPLPQVQATAAPNVRNTTRVDASGAEAIARGVNTIAGVAEKFAQQEIERNDITAVMAARRQLSDWEATTFDPQNPEGIAKFRGKNALEANESIVPSLDAKVAEIAGSLNPRQRARFDMVAGNFRDQVSGRLNNYMDREHSSFLSAEQKATIENLGQDAVNAGMSGDFGRQDSVANELLAMNRARRQAEGMGEELIKAEERGMVSAIRAQTAEAMLASDPFEAQAYFSRYADQMTPEHRAATERALYPIVSDVEAERIADSIERGVEVTGTEDVDDMIVGLESGGVATATNPNSSATGAGQFLESTWMDVISRHKPELAQGRSREEVLALRKDPALAREMVGAYRRDNAGRLAARGVAPTATNLYAAHHFGPDGGAKFAKASPNTPMTAILSRKEIAANPYLRGKTVGDVKENWRNRGLADGAPREAAPRTATDAIAYARDAIRDPRQRAAVTRKLAERNALRETQQREAEKLMSQQTYTAIHDAENPNAPLRDIIGPAAYRQAVEQGTIDSLESMRLKRIKGQFTQDDAGLVEALNREAVLNPNEFKDRNLYELAPRLSTDTLGAMLKMQKDAEDPAKRADWATTNDRIDSGARILGLEDKKQQEAFGLIYREAERAFIEREQKKPTREQADQLMRSVVREVAGDMDKLERAGSIEGFSAAMAPADRQEIISDFRALRGRDPTEAEIVMVAARFRQQQGQQ